MAILFAASPRRMFRFRAVVAVAFTACGLAGCASVGVGDMTASIATAAGSVIGGRPAGEPTPIQMFVVSTRGEDRSKGETDGAHHALDLVSVPPGHRIGRIETSSFGRPDRTRDFVLERARALDDDDGFEHELASHISGRVGPDRDVLVFVHGFNTSESEARFRLAQIATDAHFGGVPVLFTWPSQSSLFSYVKAKERATASRDALESLLVRLAATPGVGRVHVLAHSMGAWLTMEALRENAIAGKPDLDGHLGEVMLAAPDIDIDVFRNQMARLANRAHVSVLVSRGDRALDLSSRLAGDRPRVGALDPNKAADSDALARMGVRVYDLSGFSSDFIGHGVYADTPAVIRGIGAQFTAPEKGEPPTMAGASQLPPPEPPPSDASAPIVAEPLGAPSPAASATN